MLQLGLQKEPYLTRNGHNHRVEKEKFNCHICSKTLNRKENLTDHIRTHTRNKLAYSGKNVLPATNIFICSHFQHYQNGNRFKCHICSNILASRGRLANHIQANSAKKSFSCKFYEKSASIQKKVRFSYVKVLSERDYSF